MKRSSALWKRLGLLFMAALALTVLSSVAAQGAQPNKNNTFVWAARVMSQTNPLLDMDLDRVPLWTFDGLVRYTTDLKPVGDLAASWDISNGGKTYVFHLRHGVKWQDGKPFTAADVVFTVHAALNPKNNSYMKPYFMVGGKPVTVTEIDPYTVRFDLPQPSNTFLFNMWKQNTVIVPKHLLEGKNLQTDKAFNLHPIGTGPYEVIKYIPKQEVMLKANPNYFLGVPKIKYWIFKEMEDQNAALSALASDNITAMEAGGKPARKAVSKIPGVKLYGYNAGWVFGMTFNTRRAPFTDKTVRQAIAYAIKRNEMVKTIEGQSVATAWSLIGPPNTWQYDANVKRYPYDPSKAEQMLKQDGWVRGSDGILTKNGKKLEFQLAIQAKATDSDPMPFAVAIQNTLSKIGIKVDILQLDRASLQPRLEQHHNFDAYLWWDGYSFVPDLSAFWLTSSEDPSGYANPQLDQLIHVANTTPDHALRKKTLDTIAEQIANDVPIIPLYYYRGYVAIHDYVKGIPTPSGADPNNSGIFYHVWDLSIQR